MKWLKQISLYTLAGFLGAGINFLLLPYLSYFLKPEDYGILSIITSFISIIMPLIGVCAAALINVEYYKIKDQKEFASLVSSIQIIPLIPALLFLVGSFFFKEEICQWIGIPVEKSFWLVISVVLALFSIYFETLLGFNIAEQKAGVYTMFSVSRVIIEVLLTIFFVTVLRWSWEGRLLSWLIVMLLYTILMFVYFRKRKLLTSNISAHYIRQGIMFGLPLILHTIGKFVVNQSDRLFIAKMVDIKEAGIYNIGYQVGLIMLLIVAAIANFYQSYLFEKLTALSDAVKNEIMKTSYLIVLFLIVCLIVITLMSPLFFRYLVSKEYAGGVKYVFWVSLGYLFWGAYLLFSGYIFYVKQTKFLGLLAVINIVLNLVLNYFLIRAFGALGAAYATAISFFVIAAITIYRANQLFDLPLLKFTKRIH